MSNKHIVRQWVDDVWNHRNPAAIPRLLAQSALTHGLAPAGQDLEGPEGFLPFHEAFIASFADLQMTIEDLIEEDDRVAVRWRATGTLTGSGLGLQPTGKRMSVTGMSIVRVEGDQIVEAWNNFDVLGMHQQLGTIGSVAAGR